ncbi:hypothetical protein QE152_g22251 [Popillia japonica]|uniref:Peptidase A2 domain-containing protein n=1 Tax=Popillia japonica TaxID=7064 RepID=A0AAW1KJC7_POPJA
MMETPAIQLNVHECISLALLDTGASHTLVRPKWITGPTTSIPAMQLRLAAISLALLDTGASHTLVRPKWITGPTTSIPAMQLRLAAGNQTIQANQQGTLDARTMNGVHFRCPAIPVDDLRPAKRKISSWAFRG